MLKQILYGLEAVAVRTIRVQYRYFTKSSKTSRECINSDQMQAWQIHSYGNLEELKMYSNIRVPQITKPNQVLIQVEAASVNPIDVAMIKGYGSTLINFMRRANSLVSCSPYDGLELPLTLGRDFSGVIISKGHGILNKLELGDQVWGVIPVDQQGCHANYVVADCSLVRRRPKNLSHIEAASILFAGLTAWSALWFTGGLCYKSLLTQRSNNRNILVLGSSGGVGILAVQLLKAWNMNVIASCKSQAVNVVATLGADVVIDYNEEEADLKIIRHGPYDIILDCCNLGPDEIQRRGYLCNSYITLNSPLLKNVDQFGLIGGAVKNIGDILRYNVPIPTNKSWVKWGFFIPSQIGIEMLQKLVETEKIKPVISDVYPFQGLPTAYEKVQQGPIIGKVVIDMIDENR